MTKVKMYCPETMGTFKMMFGFEQPLKYIKNKRDKDFSKDYAKLKYKKKIQ
jgi:hypothetical protein